MRRRRNVTIREFVVEVGERGVQWDGLDQFLLWLVRKRPEGGFLRHARTINWFGPQARRPHRSK